MPRADVESPLPADDSQRDSTDAGRPTETRPGHGRGRFDSGPAFLPGQVIGGRFTIVRLVGRGGMGEVYEAEDAHLEERVALKTIRGDGLLEPGARERFRREVQLARKVTHVNVCRLFDFELHTTDDGQHVPFLSMELLEGETLADLLARKPRLTPAEALPLIRQIGAGLLAAHKAGIVHRDFKAANVILVPNADGQTRAVVMDFGLARSTDAGWSSTGHEFSGTPAYMAPEQAAGRETTTATDIYAFGIVIYEMVTGGLPFSGGDSPSSVARKRLTDEPLPPTVCTTDLDPAWEKAILRCLERDPADRFEEVGQILAALEPAVPETRDPSVAAALPKWRRTLVATVGLVTLIVGSATLYRFYRPETSSHMSVRRSVAVVGFKNLSRRAGDAWLSTALSEMLSTELAGSGTLRLVPGEAVAEMKRDLAIAEDADSYSGSTLRRIHRNLSSDFVIVGSYLALAESPRPIRLDLRIQDARAGETIASISETGRAEAVFDLVSRAGRRIRRELKVPVLGDEARAGAAADRVNTEAIQLYSEGLLRLRAFDPSGARALFEKAIEVDQEYAVAYSALSQAWKDLGYIAQAREAAAKALSFPNRLSREEKLLAQARLASASYDNDKVLDAYRTLYSLAPDEIDYGLQLANTLASTGGRGEAAALLERMAVLPAPLGNDTRIVLAKARLLLASQRDRDRALDLAREAGRRATRDEQQFLGARAAVVEASLLYQLDDAKGGEAALRAARATYERAGDRLRLAELLMGTSNVARPYANGEAMAREAAAIFHGMGNKVGEANALRAVSSICRSQGKLRDALRIFENALEIAATFKTTYTPPTAFGLRELHWRIRFELGDVREARKGYDSLIKETGIKTGEIPVVFLAKVLREQGELKRARAIVEPHALRKEKEPQAWLRAILANIMLLQGEVDQARECLEPVAAKTATDAMLAIDLAMILVEQDDLARAESLLRGHIQRARDDGARDVERSLLTWQLRALVLQEQLGDAKAVAERLQEILSGAENAAVRLRAQVELARFRVAAGDTLLARRALLQAIADAARLGAVSQQMESRLALAELESRQPGPGEFARLTSLQRDARARGFGLIAAKVDRLVAGRRRSRQVAGG